MKHTLIFTLLLSMSTSIVFAAQDKSEGQKEDTICLAMNQDEVNLKGSSATVVKPSPVGAGASIQ